MKIGVPRESCPGEHRVALNPASVAMLKKRGNEILVEAGAGIEAGFTDQQYSESGATLVGDPAAVYAAEVIVKVRTAAADPDGFENELEHLRPGQLLIGQCDPLNDGTAIAAAAEKGVILFSLELMPRITRAQSMDVLSSMATIAGYKAVVLAANHLPKLFPMLMTAAGTLTAARIFVVGAGVAGLQAIAASRRIGAIVKAYDVRPAVNEQVESLGAEFVEIELDSGDAEDDGGYAKELGEDFYRRQREMMLEVVAESDVVITTAVIPGKKAPILITKEMVEGMHPGSVIVDLAAERGGNCELTQAGTVVTHKEITILGPINITSTVPKHASQMYGRNIAEFLGHLAPEGSFELDLDDEITSATLITRDGQIVHPRLAQEKGA